MDDPHRGYSPGIRRRLRLHASAYEFPGPPFSITVCARARRRVFATPLLADVCFTAAHRLADLTSVHLHALCVMPDHAHVLIEASPTCDVTSFVARWKSWVSHRAIELGVERIWQPSFFDRALRRDEDLEKVAVYIVHNPVRAGLVVTVDAYPWAWMRR